MLEIFLIKIKSYNVNKKMPSIPIPNNKTLAEMILKTSFISIEFNSFFYLIIENTKIVKATIPFI